MNKEQMKQATAIVGNIARKVAESAVHAAVFAYVSKKVTSLMSKHEDKEKIRVEESTTKLDESTKTGG